jgi:hypothetical protein
VYDAGRGNLVHSFEETVTRLAFPPSEPTPAPPAQSLAEGVALSRMYGMTITPADVARLLSRAKVRYVLVGAHAINLYTGKPRATRDVDVITNAPAKARRALQQAYPHLDVEDHPVVIRFKEQGREVVDLIKAGSGKLFRKVLGLGVQLNLGGETVLVATAEAAVALKFCSMINPARPRNDRLQDAVDFSRAAGLQDKLDRSLLRQLGELVYAGGGDAVLKLLDDARAGRPLEL